MKKLLKVVLCATFTLGLSATVFADSIADRYIKGAEEGNAFDQSQLANLYMKGEHGLPQDAGKAIYWYKKAAEQGEASALCDVGEVYRKMLLDYVTAIYWFKRAVAAGHDTSYQALAVCYREEAVKNEGKELYWTRKAAEKAAADAVERNAEVWKNIAASLKNRVEALEGKGVVAIPDDDIGPEPTGGGTKAPASSAFADKCLKGANEGNASDQSRLADLYLKGEYGFPKDADKAIYWYKKAAEQGEKSAFYGLGKVHEKLLNDYKTAIYWHKRAVATGYEPAYGALANLYNQDQVKSEGKRLYWLRKAVARDDWWKENVVKLEAKGVAAIRDDDIGPEPTGLSTKAAPPDIVADNNQLASLTEIGSQWLKEAEEGDAVSQQTIASCYQTGGAQGFPKDIGRAVYWYEKAAAQGDLIALHALGRLYEKDFKNYERARYWYKRAAAAGFGFGDLSLVVLYENSPLASEGRRLYWMRRLVASQSRKALGEGIMANLEKEVAKLEAQGVVVIRDDDIGPEPTGGGTTAVAATQNKKEADDATPAWEDDFIAGTEAKERKDYTVAMRHFKRAAEKGSASAERNIGGMYVEGEGVDRDVDEGIRWIEKAVRHGDEIAEKMLPVVQDAVKRWKQENEDNQGATDMRKAIALTEEGKHAEALVHLRKAEQAGQVAACRGIAMCYLRGQGVAKDIQEGLRWADRGAARGDEKARDLARNVRRIME